MSPKSDSSASFELAVVLPLGVLANQLTKVESELRFLIAKLSRYGQERGSARGEAAARLEKMSEAVDTIRQLIAQIQADIQPQASGSTSRTRTDRED
jgi:ribosomal protein L19E